MPCLASFLLAALLPGATGTAAAELTFPPEVQAADGWYTLEINQTDLAGGAYGITTRGYTNGPTFRMKPGETLSMTLINNLDSNNNIGCDVTGTQYCNAATTNFHTHGLHVSSKGSDELPHASDDVFATVAPGSTKQYQFSIPDYHMGGTHWYHPHHHHATALQAGGGAAGVLIVDDPPGYLPEVYSSMPEKVLFISGHNLNTLQGIARDAQSTVLENAAVTAANAGLDTNVFLVNGGLDQTMTIPSHVWHRLRIVYAAVEQRLELTAAGDAACTLNLLAKDGVYLNEIPRAITRIYLHPAARADVALSCTCTAYPCTATLTSGPGRRLRPSRRAQGKPKPKPKPGGVGQGGAGPGQAGVNMAAVDVLTISVTETVGGAVESLPNTSLDFPCYLADLRGATVPDGQAGNLNLNGGARTVSWNGAGSSMTYQAVHANGATMADWPALTSFDTGKVYEMRVTGANAHPMHIHVNPFQIQDMDGAVSLHDGYYQAGDWQDTLLLPDLGGGGLLTVRMNTDKFTGKMVLHCHILSHEDEGMMAFISLTGSENAVFAGAQTLDPTCYNGAFPAAPTPAPTAQPTQAPTPTPPVTATVTTETTTATSTTSTTGGWAVSGSLSFTSAGTAVQVEEASRSALKSAYNVTRDEDITITVSSGVLKRRLVPRAATSTETFQYTITYQIAVSDPQQAGELIAATPSTDLESSMESAFNDAQLALDVSSLLVSVRELQSIALTGTQTTMTTTDATWTGSDTGDKTQGTTNTDEWNVSSAHAPFSAVLFVLLAWLAASQWFN